MIRRAGLALLISILSGPACFAATPAPDFWTTAAIGDLQAVHDIIAANHPGPVNKSDPTFTAWLNTGFAALAPDAKAARTEFDYTQVLRDYVNGFGDGHVNIAFSKPGPFWWPGFLTSAGGVGTPIRIAVAGPAGNPALGEIIEGCGGIPASILLNDRVVKPRLNHHVPQRMMLYSPWMMVAAPGDPALLWHSCKSRQGAVVLHWQPISAAQLQTELRAASGIEIPPIAIRQFGNVSLISLPTFDVEDAELAQMRNLIATLKTQAPLLHKSRHLVIDLRGNDGGDDTWGYQVAEALWGATQVDAIGNSFDESVDWRASSRNEANLRAEAETLRGQGDVDDATEFSAIADRMQTALADHQNFVSETGGPNQPMPPLNNPFLHPVYILTTPYCASACLDFIDITNALPGTVRVGLETSSDTDYLQAASATLPSGMATLHYAMKVFRHRSRPANVAFAPAMSWPGGAMTDQSVAAWIATLP